MASKEKRSEFFLGGKLKPKECYRPEDVAFLNYEEDLGDPGEYPFLRGPFHGGHTERPWRTLQYAGYGAGEDTNARWKFLLSQGQKGLNLAFDLPTQLGMDSDDPKGIDEVGRIGVAIDTLADMERLYDGIDVGSISSSYTINGTANVLLAMYVALARKQGVSEGKLRGTLQNDILKEYTSRGAYIYPPKPSVKMVCDVIEYCVKQLPKMNAVNVGCHMLGAGATQIQTWALMFATGAVYIEECLRRGLEANDVLSHITFLTNVNMDFLETIAVHRAARRLWARIAKSKFGASNSKAMAMRMGTGIHAVALVDRQPLNNIARITIMALAAALAGTQSMHLASYDESYAIPSEEATRTSLMVQHILINETDICRTADPLGGSYAIEALTEELENGISGTIASIEEQGGIVKLIEQGDIQRQIAKQAFEEAQRVESGEKVIIGVNKYAVEEDRSKYEEGIFQVDHEIGKRQIKRLNDVRSGRNKKEVEKALDELREAAKEDKNLMPDLVTATEKYCSIGEICGVLKDVYGEYRDISTI